MSAFNPRRLTLARKRRGLNKSELADAVGVSRRAISGFESGDMPPSETTVAEIAAALGFPVEFFSGDNPVEVSPDTASFRAMSRMTATQRSAVFAAGSLAVGLNELLGKHLSLPEAAVPDLRDEDPETAAVALRAAWKIGVRPIGNVIHLLEANGVRVFSLTGEGREVDAYSMWADNTPFVFLNTIKSGERGRFDAAHELGHLVLHRHGSPRGVEAENEADRFASAFLMPAANLSAMAPRVPTVGKLLELKKVWLVSVAALARRLYDLKLTTQWHYEQLCIEISKRGWRTSEPDGIPRETSQLLKKAFIALREMGLTHHDIAAQLRITAEDLDALVFQLVPVVVSGGRTEPATPPADRKHLRLIS
ncbi:ImmA/IrrE family metallo-endopeptidase [Corallococcus sp. AB030]|uniref:XRE family transcriptional regulator n=1 Tax=Corallococcus sp. AB030 TaxID=2316716 RepID=UPI000EB9F573|nr:XRE family transcriptional regulator [Corallococcus sp. AB030]RKH96376.1 ImmA/IrrE family metallo-endopeptidase [Corallococcus sp. AB030]